MRFTLRQLEVFLAVARRESVSRAAEDLALSQSAVSGALADLERQFDIQLFDRIGKRLQLSHLGRGLRPRAHALYEEAETLERTFASQDGMGLLRVGATLTIGNYIAPQLMARFMGDHPGARVALRVANTADIVRRVLNFELDVGLIEGERHHEDLDVQHWKPDELAVFCAPGHPLANRPALSDAELSKAPWIVRERGSGTRQAFERAMHGLPGGLSISLELEHTEAIIRAVQEQLGVGCISRIALAQPLRHGDVVLCHVPQRDFVRQFSFVLHKRKFRSPAVQAWVDLCRSAAS